MKKLILLCIFFLHLNFVNAQTSDTAITHSMEVAVENGTYPNVHSILISYNNELIYEKYWAGKDKKIGKDLGFITHGKDSLHDIRSISKSVTSACVGIALEQGKIKSIHQNIFDFFPEYAAQDTALKAAITIKDLLTMTTGLQWNEDYGNPESDEDRMDTSDPIAYVLSRPMMIPPGKTFNYSGGATELLAAIVQKATGKPIDLFAKEYLFTPLGISAFEWVKYSETNLAAPAWGLRLKSRDLLKFGLLYMNGGKLGTRQIVPLSWVTQSLTSYFNTDDRGTGYGFQFWVWTDTIINKPVSLAVCIGNGGQRIFIDKSNKLVVVVNAGNYNTHDQYAYSILTNFIYPALFNKEK